jgi:long-chain acyl-CoA synthetase
MEEKMNLAELAEAKIGEFGEYVSLIFDGNEYTNIQMHEGSRRLAAGLKRLGIRPGDRVMVLMPNCPEVLMSYPAIWRIGAVIVPVLFLLEPSEVAYIAADCEASAIITSPEFLYKVDAVRKKVPSLRHVIIVGNEEHPDTIQFKRLVEESKPEDAIHPTDAEDTAALLYTSGTTGRPKGVMLSHRNLYANAMNIKNTAGDQDRGDVSLAVLPLAHSYGLGLLVSGYVSDKTNKAVLLPWFNLESLFQLIEKYKVSSMAGVPTMYIYMLHYPDADRYDISSMRYWLVGAAPMAQETLRQFEEKFGGIMYVAYGLTEASPGVASERDDFPRKPGSTGKPLVGVEVKIFDESDRELAPGQIGEIVCRGGNVMKGYFKMPEETKETLKGGWLHTGDMGYLDEEGYLFIVERKKDLIIRGGFNIYPKDVEETLHMHPAVAEAAVIGAPDEMMGEQVVAYVVLRPNAQATAEELISHCQLHLARYKCPKRIEFLDSMPKTPIGKIQKKELRKLVGKSG